MSCEYRKEVNGQSRCSLAEKWGQLSIVNVGDDACKVCLSSNKPKQVNRVVASLVVNQARLDKDSRFNELLQRARPYLTEPGMVEKISRYASSTQNWIQAGSPIRNDEEVETVLSICRSNQCEQFVVNKDGETGHCKVCGCELNRMGGLVNKIRRATEHCPIGKW